MTNKLFGRISPVIGYAILLLTILAGIGVRLIQLLFAIDYNTGFYKTGHYSVKLLVVMLSVLIPVSILVTLIAKRENLAVTLTEKKSKVLTILYILVAAAMAVQAVGKIAVSIVIPSADKQLKYDPFDMALIILLVISCVSFISLAKNNSRGKESGAVVVVPAVYLALKLMQTFMSHTTIANISENLFDILSLCAGVIFLCVLSKYAINIPGKKSEVILIISAFCTAVFGAINLTPHIIVIVFSNFSNKGNISTYALPLAIDQIAVTVLALVYIGFYLCGKKKKLTVTEDDIVSDSLIQTEDN